MNRIDALPPLPDRPADGHKGTFGRVLVIAGSRGMSGAACLCATAALRGGSGLVSAAVPEGIVPIVAAQEPSYLTVSLPEDADGRIDSPAPEMLVKHARGTDAVAVGPGLGQSTALRLLVTELYRTLPQPLVVDADALNLLAKNRVAPGDHAGPRILTPHPGEFARLCGLPIDQVQQDRQGQAGRFADQHKVTLVLKGPGTIITDGDRVAVNTTGNAGMATGGSGDVLTGLIASLAGQGMPAFEAAQLGVFVHGAAGDHAADLYGMRSMIASDLLQTIGDAWPAVD